MPMPMPMPMPTARPFVAALAFALLLSSSPAAAQDGATPAATAQEQKPGGGTADAGTGPADAALGAEVPFVDETGQELAVVSAVAVADPFDDFGESFTPEEGARYVAVEVAIRGTGGSVDAEPYDFGLQTADGFYFSPTSVSRDITAADTPDLDTIQVVPDSETSGLVFFAIPTDAEIARLFWQPDSGRLILVADLRT